MRIFSISSAKALRADIAAMYKGTDDEAARLRATHIASVLRLTPPMMFANVGSAVLAIWTYSPRIPNGMWLWLTLVCVMCGLAMLNWWERRRRTPPLMASRHSVHHATWHAATLSGLWAVMPILWFAHGTAGQQMTVATLEAGMISAGGFVLSPLPYASIVWAGLLCAGSIAALLQTGETYAYALAMLLLLYTTMVMISAVGNWQKETALLRAQARSARQEQTLSVLLQDFEQNAGDALWETDEHGHLMHPSSRLKELLGLPADSEPTETLLEIIGRCSTHCSQQLDRLMAGGQPFRELALALPKGRGTVHLLMNGKPLRSETGAFQGWRGVMTDVTEKVRNEELLRRLAHTDALTDLANRRTLRDALGQVLARQVPLALLTIDLDRFKAINDNHGHSTGDAMLLAVSRRLKRCVGPDAMVARLGGDEFAVVLSGPDALQEAPRLAQRLVDVLGEPVEIGPRTLRVGASVGLATCSAEPMSIDDLLVQADMAMYACKEAGRSQWTCYTAALGENSRRRLALESGLRVALERGELSLHWQPRVDLASGRISSAEALMRWAHPELGNISPGEFIPLAEQCGQIDALGEWALQQACQAATSKLSGLIVSVNVSPIQLLGKNFLGTLREVLQRSGLDPARLELELTESVFIDSPAQALEVMRAVRETGVRLALDDFGTGYSSLSYLRSFPFDTLKIDRTFVAELMSADNAHAIVRMIVDLATTLGMRTTCEGIETPQQLQAVLEAGCHEVQGYLISPPKPLQDFADATRFKLPLYNSPARIPLG